MSGMRKAEILNSCENCAWHDDTAPRWGQCIPCRDTGVDISRDPVCRLYVRKGEEGDRNQYGLEPCTCGCRDVRVHAHWKGVGMGESCDCTITCPKCGRMMAADDFGVRWNATMIKERKDRAEREKEEKEEEEEMSGMMKAEILNCPYCKNRADVRAEHIDGLHSSWVYIACTRCGARGPHYICDDTDTARYIIMATNMWNMIARDDE